MTRRNTLVEAPYAMRCRCGEPLAMADMRWFQPPRPVHAGEGPIRQVVCERCALGRSPVEAGAA